jgi:hypothetical protein
MIKSSSMTTSKLFAAAATIVLAAGSLTAQTKTITGETKTVTATVEAIEKSTREVTVKKPDGTYDIFVAPEGMRRFDTLKIGDKITAKYYENIVLRMKAAGEKPVNSAEAAVVRAGDGKAAGTTSVQRTITATIAAIDPKIPSISFTGPNGWKYTSRVEDKKALEKVKVGDKLDITWTEAMILSLDDGK